MTKFTTTALATLMAFTALVPVMDGAAEARRRHSGAIVGGVILGAAALAIIANSNSARADGYGRRRNGFAYTCNKWYNQCINGYNYACEKYETRGCTE
jgi:hypothetical protein